MRKFAGTWIVLGAFGVLLAWLLIAKPKSKDERKEDSLTVAKSTREQIDRIQIVNPNGSFLLARVSGGGPTPTPPKAGASPAAPTPTPAPEVWKIQKPREFPVEETALNQMKNSLSDLVAVDPVWTDATDEQLDKVGLKEPKTVVTWHDDKGEHGLLIGKPFAKNDEIYVRAKDSKKVFLARKWGVEIFGKSLSDLRRHRLFDFERDAVRKIELTAKGNGTLAASRADVLAPWKTTTPFVGRADRGKVNNFLARLANLRADSFPADVDEKKAGLDDPRGRITVTTDDGKTYTLLVGGDAGSGKWYAKDASSKEIVVCAAQTATDLKDPFATAWRDKTLLDFPVDEVSSLEITTGGKTIGLKQDDSQLWHATGGSHPAVNAEVSQFLRTVKTATVSDRAENAPAGSVGAKRYGFDAPELTASWVAGTGATAQKIELTVGRAKSNAHWVRTSESPQALLVPQDLLAAAKALEDAALKPMVTGTAGTATASKGT